MSLPTITSHNQADQPAQIGSVPLHQIDKEEGELSKTSRQESCVSTSTLAPSNTQTLSSRNKKDDGRERKPRRSIGQRLDHAVLNLAPSFFSLNMGTGITSILLYNLPYNAGWLQRLGIVIFVLNILMFVLISIGHVVRYIRFKGLFTATIKHLMSGMFWGTLPMGLITIVNMLAFVCVPWGWGWAQFTLALWWIDVLISILVNFGMVFMMFSRHKHTPESVASAWLLPIVSSVVAAASGGVVSNALLPYSTSLARSTIIVSYVVWGTGVPPAMFIITLWIYRSAIHGLPAAPALPSVFLPLGPCGQGAFGIILLGKVTRNLAYNHDLGFSVVTGESARHIADAIYAGGLVTGLILWGLGFMWYILATVFFVEHCIRNRSYLGLKSFSVAFTALTFPIGVWATATTELAAELDSPAFKVIGTIVSIQVALNWLYVFLMTCWKVADGTVFVAPEVAGFEGGRPPLRWGSKKSSDDRV